MRIFLTSVHRERRQDAPSYLDDLLRCAESDVRGRHSVAADPDEADCILITEAWRHEDRPFFRDIRTSRMGRAHPDTTFVYCDADRPPFLGPGLYPSVDARLRDPRSQDGFCYLGGERRWPEGNSLFFETTPDLLFSFSGSTYTHRCRSEVLKLAHPRAELFDSTRIRKQGSSEENERIRAAFAEQMARSRFVLCPRGKGASSFRLFETMAAGRVPVIISDAWVPPPGIAWDECSVRVPERAIHSIPQLLESLEPVAATMATNAQQVYAESFSTTALFDYIGESLRGLMARRGHAGRSHWRSHALEVHEEGKALAKTIARGVLPRS